MAQNSIISQSKINQAANGNQALRDLLNQVVQTTTLQQTVTNTQGKNVPQQANAAVSFLNSTYIVQIQNPGSVSATSALQQAQATAGASLATSVAPVTPIYHQIRVATKPTFSQADNVQTFGGDTGSTQTYWELSGLGSGRYYFQVRSSYEGVNWNLWRNANGGQTITRGVEGVTTETVNNAVWAAFTLSGDQLCAFGSGFVQNDGSFDVVANLYTSAMQAIPGPNGFQQTGNLAHGIRNNKISITTPSVPQALTGPADYPTLVTEGYEDGEGHTWPGSANIFGFAYDPLGSNVKLYSTPAGNWVVFTLPGGAQFAVGCGTVANGTDISSGFPAALAWVTPATLLGIVTSANAFDAANHAHGVNAAGFTGMTVSATWEDGEGHIWGNTANWFAVAFSPGFAQTAVTGGKFVTFDLPDGTKVAIGSGVTASGSSFGLPAGFASDKSLSIGVPVSFNDTGHAMAGVSQCSVDGTLCTLAYQDGADNFWDGNVGWMTFCWE